MSYEEEFDKIVRQKAEEADYPFDAGNWEKAREMMDTERTGAAAFSVKKWVISGGLALGISIIALIAFNHNNSSTTNESDLQTNTLAPELPNEQKIDNAAKAIENTAKTPLALEQTLPAADESQTEKITQAKPGQINKQTAQVTQPEKELSAIDSEIPPAADKPDQAANVESAEPAKTVARSEEVLANTPIAESITPFAGENNNKILPLVATNEPGSTSGVIAPPAANSNVNQQELPSPALPLAVSADEVVVTEELQLISSGLPYAISENEIKAIPFVLLKRYEDEYITAKFKSHHVNLELGANYLVGWDAANGTDGSGLNWFGGFNYRYYLTNKFGLGLGVQAYNIAGISQPFYSSTQKIYGFGSTYSNTTVTSSQLFYVSIPLKLAYDLNTSHQLGLSFNAGYLAAAKYTVSSYMQESDGVESVPEEKTEKGVYEGAKRSNYLLGVFYNAHITRKLALNAEFTYGLSDIFYNYGAISNSEKTTGYRLSLQYTLFER